MHNIAAMGEITAVSRASSNFASLHTVIPMSIIKQWKLKEGDKIDWSGGSLFLIRWGCSTPVHIFK